MRILPFQWSTERMMISNSDLAEASELTEVFNSCNYVEAWDPDLLCRLSGRNRRSHIQEHSHG